MRAAGRAEAPAHCSFPLPWRRAARRGVGAPPGVRLHTDAGGAPIAPPNHCTGFLPGNGMMPPMEGPYDSSSPPLRALCYRAAASLVLSCPASAGLDRDRRTFLSGGTAHGDAAIDGTGLRGTGERPPGRRSGRASVAIRPRTGGTAQKALAISERIGYTHGKRGAAHQIVPNGGEFL